MLAELGRQLAQLQEEERQQPREVAQREADETCAQMWKDIGGVLKKDGKFQGTNNKALAALRAVGGTFIAVTSDILNMGDIDLQFLNQDEIITNWSLSKKVDLGGEEPELVTLVAHGGISPDKSFRKFIRVQNTPHQIELQEDHGVMWNAEKVGDHTRFLRTNRKANQLEANFYQEALSRFQHTP